MRVTVGALGRRDTWERHVARVLQAAAAWPWLNETCARARLLKAGGAG